MVFRMKNDALIENVRQYPDEIVETLREALAEGIEARPDPKRKGCYDIVAGSRTYYIFVTPRGKIVLVASWARPAATPEARRSELSLQGCCPGSVPSSRERLAMRGLLP